MCNLQKRLIRVVYKSGTGTRGRGHRDACVGTWGRETRDLSTSSMGREDVWDEDAGGGGGQKKLLTINKRKIMR